MHLWLTSLDAQSTAASVLLVAAAILPFLPIRLPLWVQVVLRLASLAVLTLLLKGIVHSPTQPVFDSAHPEFELWQRLIETGWWLVVARVVVGFGRLFLVLENRPRETRLVSDLAAGAIYTATLLAIVNFALEVPIRGLLATSGVVAIVLGLALQSTLSDVFSGIAVGLERPYKPGDLIWVEGGLEGRVVQLNWRSTQIATAQDNLAIIPNSIMAKSRMINRSAPTVLRTDTVSLQLDPATAPDLCVATLHAAVRACGTMLASPPPGIAFTGLKGDGATYDITFSVASSEQLTAARAEIFRLVHRHLRYAGIPLAVNGIAVLPKIPVPTPSQLLQSSDLFGIMETADRDMLAAHFRERWLDVGDMIVQEGALPEALYLIATGAAEVTRAANRAARYFINPGEAFGTLSLVTGAPSAVTATAVTRLKLYELGKPDIAAAIKAKPELAHGLEALAARGRTALAQFATETEKQQLAKPDIFVAGLRAFLRHLHA